jgi:hypothetical protein
VNKRDNKPATNERATKARIGNIRARSHDRKIAVSIATILKIRLDTAHLWCLPPFETAFIANRVTLFTGESFD